MELTGGTRVRPGEISLAHRGVLFLDELPEFSRQALDALRQPLETGEAVVSRANAHVTYPARFQLIAAMNPCKCGHLGNPALACNKAPRCAGDYQGRLSGPLLDRIDLHVEVPPVKPWALAEAPENPETTKTVLRRVLCARARQEARYSDLGLSNRILCNAELGDDVLDQVAVPDKEAQDLLLQAADKMHLSARGYRRVLKVSRTIADMVDADKIQSAHIAEALSYRRVTHHKAR